VQEEKAVLPAAPEERVEPEARVRRINMHLEGLLAELLRLRTENANLQRELEALRREGRQAVPEDEATEAFVVLDDIRRFMG
jgi:molecular chaperone GrpE (heat shock protein)